MDGEVMKKVLLQIFVDYENLGKTLNILTNAKVTGFYCIEYWGASPQTWEGFVIKEEPEMALEAIRTNAERAIQINTVVNDPIAEDIKQAIQEGLGVRGKRYTIMKIPIDSIKVMIPE
jgi:nitrogen regulatory protein PII-like uncharacterized protein